MFGDGRRIPTYFWEGESSPEDHPATIDNESDESEEGLHLDYFRTVCAGGFDKYFSTSLWKKSILALHRFQRHSKDDPISSQEATFSYPRMQYCRAIKSLNQRLDKSPLSSELAIIASLLFMAIEVLQGNDLEALTHSKWVCNIEEFIYPIASSVASLPQSIDDDFRVREKNGLEICVSSCSLRYRSQYFYIPCLPRQFSNILEARNSLDTIISHIHFFLRLHAERYKTLPYHSLPSEVLDGISDIQNLLSRWKDIFDSFFKALTTAEGSLRTSSKVLLIQQTTGWISMSTNFCGDEISYDEFYLTFKYIVDLADQVVVSTGAACNPSFPFDVGIIQPLFFTACRCRDPILRRYAADLLPRCGQEGVYDGCLLAAVARWLIEQEEAGLEAANGFVIERNRIDEIGFTIERQKKKVIESCSKKGCEDEWIYFADMLRWGDDKCPESSDGQLVAWWLERYKEWHLSSMYLWAMRFTCHRFARGHDAIIRGF